MDHLGGVAHFLGSQLLAGCVLLGGWLLPNRFNIIRVASRQYASVAEHDAKILPPDTYQPSSRMSGNRLAKRNPNRLTGGVANVF